MRRRSIDSRLCRLPCGKPPAFRQSPRLSWRLGPEAKPLSSYGANGKPEAFRTGGGKAAEQYAESYFLGEANIQGPSQASIDIRRLVPERLDRRLQELYSATYQSVGRGPTMRFRS